MIKNNSLFLILISILLITNNISGICQLIPDFSMSFKVISPMGEDSVILGLSTNAGEGFDEAYDIIDTSSLKLPVDLRIYDPKEAGLLNDACKHFTTSYQSFPTKNTHQIATFERTFIIVLRIDLEQINNWTHGGCNEVDPETDTFLQMDLTPMYDYQFKNNVGFSFDKVEIIPSGNVNLLAIDGTSWDALSLPIEACAAILAYNFPANHNCDVDIIFNLTFKINNETYVGIEEILNDIQIIAHNHQIQINNAPLYTRLSLFNLNGTLLQQKSINNNNVIFDTSPYGKQIFLLHLSDPSNSHFLIHKILNL